MPTAGDYNCAVRLDSRWNLAAFAGWFACSAPGFLDIAAGRLDGARAIVWTTAFVVYAMAYALYLRTPDVAPPLQTRWLVALQAATDSRWSPPLWG